MKIKFCSNNSFISDTNFVPSLIGQIIVNEVSTSLNCIQIDKHLALTKLFAHPQCFEFFLKIVFLEG